MADTAISGLADLATLADDDEFPVLDLSASETKAVTVANLRTSMQSGITSYTDEMARDAIGSAMVAGSGISVTVDDGADTITVAAAAASTTVSGIVELATDAETITGTDTVRAVTPAGLAAKVASATAVGIVELATTAEVITGTDTVRAVTPEGFAAGLAKQPEVFIIAVGDETTALTTGTAKVTWRMPFAFTLSAVRASLTTGSSSGTPTVDINEGGTSILSTKLTIDANELTSTTAATAAVISDTALADDASMTIDIDTAGTAAAGLKVYLIGTRA